VHQVEPLQEHDRVIVLIARLAVLKAAIDSELIGFNRGYVLDQSYRYWRHRSGKYFAVEFRRGKLCAACGPIAFEEIDARKLPHLPYKVGALTQWVERHRSEFRVHKAS
jgi:hypothetical protein